MQKTALIFDLDNTLVETDLRYTECNEAFGEFAARLVAGVSAAEATEFFIKVDAEACLNGRGFEKERYPEMMQEALRMLADKGGVGLSAGDLDEAYAIGERVYKDPYDLYPGVREMLAQYREAGVLMALCTKGDSEIQIPLKIDHNGLMDLFDVVDIWEQAKGAAEIRRTADRLGVDDAVVGYMVGDSMRDDIVGGHGAGLRTVLIDIKHHAWDYNKIESEIRPDHIVECVTELPTIVRPRRVRRARAAV